MSEKSRAIYKFLMKIIKEIALHLNLQDKLAWENVTHNFDMEVFQAFQDSIPLIHHCGCHYQFCQRIFRKVSILGLEKHYMNSDFPHFGMFVRCVLALAFLPVERIESTFKSLVDYLEAKYERAQIDYPDELVDFVAYLQKTWISDDSKFRKELWNSRNVYRDKTIGVSLPLFLRQYGDGTHLWNFIRRLQKIEKQTRVIMEDLKAGRDFSKNVRFHRVSEDDLGRMIARYNNGAYPDNLIYVQEIAYLQHDFLMHKE